MSTESACMFQVDDDWLLGILSRSPEAAATAVLVIVGGPQYRVGSHRQFVSVARALAAAGFPCLRFDYRGMGDSTGGMRTFEAVTDDIGAAIDLLFREVDGLRRVVLWGLCDGASAALLYCQARRDARVGGLCLLNPWVRSAATLARTHVKHYYWQRLGQRAFWQKLLSGGVGASALRGLLSSLRLAGRGVDASGGDFQGRMATAWRQGNVPVLLVLSGDDYTAREFVEATQADARWAGALQRAGVVEHAIAGADHTFSDPVTTLEVNAVTVRWLAGLAPVKSAGVQA